jgi:ubiquinone/menaquinone biosynthesis C-methylase UbiE
MENKIIIDNDSNLGYEKKKWFYFLMMPIIWLLALWVALKKKILGPNLKINTFWFDGISPICRKIKENATNWRALDIIYNYEFRKRKGVEGEITDFWLKILNAQAVRNRLKLVKQTLKEEIEKISQKESEIKLVSIASGSAQGVIEVMAEFKEKEGGTNIKAIFLDLDSTAIEHGKKLAQKAGITDQIIFINKGVNMLEEALKDFSPHIIEVVGFLEYRAEEKAIKLIEKIYRLLPPGGLLLVSNVCNNLEKLFLYHIVNWPMIYRSPRKLAKLLIKGGFNSKNIKIIYEPLKIHEIAICQKPF